MSYDIYYTIRKNKKTYHEIDTLFFGKQKVYDYEKVFETPIFDTYEECLRYIYDKNIINVHIRKTLSTGGGVWDKDYKTAFNTSYKGKDFRKENNKEYAY